MANETLLKEFADLQEENAKLKKDNERMSKALSMCATFLEVHGWVWPEELIHPDTKEYFDMIQKQGYVEGETMVYERALGPLLGMAYVIKKENGKAVYRHVPLEGSVWEYDIDQYSDLQEFAEYLIGGQTIEPIILST